ncbi:MAG TPA: MATE family efflux transporter [Gemmatales bacterium]|nr:MATE family efflux transporter [Gemmatales bacterium]
MTPTAFQPTPTSGRLLIELLRIAVPLIISSFFFTLQLLIDRLMLSWYSPDALAAAGAAAMAIYVPIILLQNTAAFATFVAQYIGARRPHEVGAILHQALIFSLVTGTAFMPLALASDAVVAWIGHESRLQPLESTYLACLCFAILPMLITATATALFAGSGRPGVVIAISAVGTVVNAVLDYGLIFGHWGLPAWGVFGAGVATVGGFSASALLALALLYRPRYVRDYGLGWPRWNGHLFGRLMFFGIPNGLQGAIDVLAWTSLTLFIGWLGTAELAASMLVFNVNAAFLVPMLGMGQALSVLVGQHLGAERPDLAERSVWLGVIVGVGVVTFMGVTVACLPGPILALFESSEDPASWVALAQLVPTLLIFVAVYSFFDSLGIMLTFALRGAGDTRFVTLATLLLSSCVMVLPVYLVTSRSWSLPAEGLWWAWAFATTYIVSMAVCFLLRFVWGPWRKMRVIEPAVIESDADVGDAPEARSPTLAASSSGL